MKYFTVEELTKSITAIELGIDNIPNTEAEDNIIALIDNVLDPIREKWGRPIYVNSGYRCDKLNEKVGGAHASQHRFGEAADITAGNSELNKELFRLILDLHKNGGIEFGQLIDEKKYSWLHISYSDSGNKNQILHL